jgi:hypothetical protein
MVQLELDLDRSGIAARTLQGGLHHHSLRTNGDGYF